MYEPGDRVSWLIDGRLYLGVVEETRCTSETFEVLWFYNGRRGRFVHGGEPADFRHTRLGDREKAVQIDETTGRIAELSSLLINYKHWPREVCDILAARYRALSGVSISAGR